ncbi:MAG: undecaprenyl-diphosphate phosphatase [Acidimicrobiia bacterium]|nr:undecaprenyl-diphosphate phosphatase [Acidimicrobiia bacterium]MYC46327.1 undecaprenyl-diphosphate phosphatase [Acidimicrobiia bacterium]
MSVLEAILLGILQGLTEFLPISSSGHLQLVTWLADWEPFDGDPSVWTAFEVALHVGTLAGVLAYFGREVVGLAAAGVRQVTGRRSPEGRRAWLLVLATVPAGIVGVAAGSALERNERVWVTGCTLALFGVWLWWADRRSVSRPDAVLGGSDALALGVAQALALVPGVSRSGAIMTAARLRGYSRLEAARVAMLMSVPVIAGAAVYKLIDLGGWSGIPADAQAAFVWGTVAAALSGWAAVSLLVTLVRRIDFAPFALYRAALGISVLVLMATSFRNTPWI